MWIVARSMKRREGERVLRGPSAGIDLRWPRNAKTRGRPEPSRASLVSRRMRSAGRASRGVGSRRGVRAAVLRLVVAAALEGARLSGGDRAGVDGPIGALGAFDDHDHAGLDV